MGDENDLKRKQEEMASPSREELLFKLAELEKQNKELKEHLSTINEKVSSPISPETPSKKTKLKKDRKELKSKQTREFDFSRYNKRYIALKIAYLGWDFHGFASQENIDNTIEAHLFSALLKTCLIEERSTCNYSRCGRTDKGVSAFGQVISLEVRTNLDDGDGVIQRIKDKEIAENPTSKNNEQEEIPYAHLLNKLLPSEIRVLAWAPVSFDFKARFSCVHRKYKYYFPAGDMDIETMNQAGKKFVGEHDFRNFCKMDVGNNVTSFYRNVLSVEVQRLDNSSECSTEYDMCVITVCGMAFLWHQVRCMTSLLMFIGQRLEQPQIIDHMLNVEKCPRRPQYNMASEIPLVLFDCKYDGLEWIYHPDHLKDVSICFQKLWTASCIKTTMMREMLDSLNKTSSNLGNSEDTNPECIPCVDHNNKTKPGLSLIPGHHVKSYKKLLTRALCDSLETKLENLSAKRMRLKNEPVAEGSNHEPNRN